MRFDVIISLILTTVFSIWVLGVGTYGLIHPAVMSQNFGFFCAVFAGLIIAWTITLFCFILCYEGATKFKEVQPDV
jgi:hypothetical protein